jgi:hypothetical protein
VTLLAENPTEPSHQDIEALFGEARRRRRRRWLVAIAGIVTLVVAGTIAAAIVTSGSEPPGTAPPGAPSQKGPITSTVAAPRVAWVDYYGKLHIGNLDGLTQQVVTPAHADPAVPLVTAGSRIFWVRVEPPKNAQGPELLPRVVISFDPSTGRTHQIGRALQVIPSLDRSSVYLETNSGTLTEYWPGGTRRHHVLQLPKGWSVSSIGSSTPVVADGILVESATNQQGTAPSTLAIWNPSTGRVRAMGKVWNVIGTYTPPGGRRSLVAWLPANCLADSNCSLRITDTSNLSYRSVANPLGFGFDSGGAFSPDGRQLAVFANFNDRKVSQATQLGMVDTRSGTLHMVPAATIGIGDPVAWAQWLPEGTHLIAGGTTGWSSDPSDDNHFMVDTWTGQVVPFRFLQGPNQDVNYSVVATP